MLDAGVATARFTLACMAMIAGESGAGFAVPDCAEAASVGEHAAKIPLSATIEVAARKRNAALPEE